MKIGGLVAMLKVDNPIRYGRSPQKPQDMLKNMTRTITLVSATAVPFVYNRGEFAMVAIGWQEP